MVTLQDKNNKLSGIDHGSEDFAYSIFKTLGILKLKQLNIFFLKKQIYFLSGLSN